MPRRRTRVRRRGPTPRGRPRAPRASRGRSRAGPCVRRSWDRARRPRARMLVAVASIRSRTRRRGAAAYSGDAATSRAACARWSAAMPRAERSAPPSATNARSRSASAACRRAVRVAPALPPGRALAEPLADVAAALALRAAAVGARPASASSARSGAKASARTASPPGATPAIRSARVGVGRQDAIEGRQCRVRPERAAPVGHDESIRPSLEAQPLAQEPRRRLGILRTGSPPRGRRGSFPRSSPVPPLVRMRGRGRGSARGVPRQPAWRPGGSRPATRA